MTSEPCSSRYRLLCDWGTTNARFFLQKDDGSIIATHVYKGARETQDFASVIRKVIKAWAEYGPTTDAWLAGMVGSSFGWVTVPYVNTPASFSHIARKAHRLSVDTLEVKILPGIQCINPLGQADVMRGEETQIVGAFNLHPDISDERLLCLPGTHCKWAISDHTQIKTFMTGFTGELYGLLSTKSTLIGSWNDNTFNDDEEAFIAAAELVYEKNHASLLHSLFSVRAYTVTEGWPITKALSHLSGLIITADVIGAMHTFYSMVNRDSHVLIIGEQALAKKYKTALDLGGWSADIIPPDKAVIAGMSRLSTEQ